MHTITVTRAEKVGVRFLKVSAGVRYWEDATVNGIPDEDGTLIPCRKGERWEPLIDIDAGEIAGWPAGTTAKIHYKVCDDGQYVLLDQGMNTVREIDGYVPDIMSPADSGYGDYIMMNVGADGRIADWKVVLDEFERQADE